MKKLTILALSFSVIVACKSNTSSEKQQDTTQAVAQTDTTAIPVGETLWLDDVIACGDYDGLVKKYGTENIEKKATVTTGEGSFEVTKLYPNTVKEVEIYWKDGKEYKKIQDALARLQLSDDKPLLGSPWASKSGIRLGMKLSEVIKANGKTFTITGLGWDLGGMVVSWEGGTLGTRNINVRFDDYSTNNGGLSSEQYADISGDREFDVNHPSIQKLNPIVSQVSVFAKPEIDKALGNKMLKQVEEKQMPKH
jgi:uncharacterized protein (DUF1330 family)